MRHYIRRDVSLYELHELLLKASPLDPTFEMGLCSHVVFLAYPGKSLCENDQASVTIRFDDGKSSSLGRVATDQKP